MTTSLSSMMSASRQKKAPTLSLVALMDIFTVLVFFLMFNVHSDQAIEQSRNVLNLPLSAQAIDHLTMDAQVDVLEIPNESAVIFNGQYIALDETLNTLTAQVQATCNTPDDVPSPTSDEEKTSDDTQAPQKCQRLAIEAPDAMPYPFVNRFVVWGKAVGFRDIYLIVTKKNNTRE
ncbi:biopolymer transporter ExbD [Vibrio parahaemolyticus]|uniref:biopolymer transporter ExbD n=1 Tax=Vibrio parahaemolyticus TaxID=670 RepID=UPI001E628424|nr:biopolymer transporter ExbD [Vibrio parahaemolyticus]MCD1416903.1 biopolymer transporter ExbD [Vibrio parahaemolyticus]